MPGTDTSNRRIMLYSLKINPFSGIWLVLEPFDPPTYIYIEVSIYILTIKIDYPNVYLKNFQTHLYVVYRSRIFDSLKEKWAILGVSNCIFVLTLRIWIKDVNFRIKFRETKTVFKAMTVHKDNLLDIYLNVFTKWKVLCTTIF